MNKIYLIIVAILLVSGCGKDKLSDIQSQYFIKFYGNPGADKGYDVKQTSDGGYILIGSTYAEETDDDIIIIKTDKFGNKKWQIENIGDSLTDVGNRIIEHENSFYFMGTNQISSNNSDIIIGNIDNNGNISWIKNIGGAGIQEGKSFIIDSDNNFVIVGSTNIVPPYGDTLANNISNIFMLKATISGDSITSSSLYGPNLNLYDDYGQDIIQKTDGNYLIAANSQSNSTNKTLYKAMFVEMATNFSIVKSLVPNLSLETIVKSILLTSNQELYFIGSQRQTSVQITDIFLAKVNSNLSALEWSKTFGGENNDIGYGIVECDGGLAFIGTSDSFDNNNDIYFQKTDTEGNPLETYQIIGGTGNEEGRNLYATTDNGFIIVGINSFDSNADIALIKTDESGLLK